MYPYPAALLLTTAMCAAFASAGAVGVLILASRLETPIELSQTKLLIRIGGFWVAAIVAAFVLSRLPTEAPDATATPPADALTPMQRSLLLCLLSVAGFASVFGVSRYPHAEPDELHHLIVARNVAELGQYASGQVESGLTHFDPYDSVGPSVILPVAAAFRLFGTSLTAARVVMAAFFVLLCLAAFHVMRRPFGPWTALGSAVLLVAALGSIYLARTLYGESAALFYALCGCLAWRQALDRPDRMWWWSIAAGLCFGCAMLAKFFLIILAFPLAAALLYDGFYWKRSNWVCATGMAVGAVTPIILWAVAPRLLTPDGADTAAGMSSLYMHYLLIGLSGLPTGFDLILNWLVPAAMAGVALIVIVPRLFGEKRDPILLALWLTAVFILFWWFFFTPGRIVRYLWYSFAIAGLFAAPAIAMVNATLRAPKANPVMRGAAWIALLGFAFGIWRTTQGPLQAVVSADHMAGDRALVAYLDAVPADHAIGSTFYTVPRIASFFANRPVKLLEFHPQSLRAMPVVVVPPHHGQQFERVRKPDAMAGPYLIYRNDIE